MEKPETFANRMQQLLDIKQITKAELSRRTGISRSSITRYVKGDWKGKQDSVYKIAEVMNVSEAWLMGYDVPMQRTQPQDHLDAYYQQIEADGRKREQTWVENTPQGLIIAPEPIDGHYDLSYRSSHEKEELRSIIASILHELDRYEDRGHIGAAKVLMHAAKIIWTRNDEGISRIDEYVSMIGSNENYAEYDLPAYLLPGFLFDHEGFSEEDADAAFRDWIEHQPEDVRKEVLHPQKEEK